MKLLPLSLGVLLALAQAPLSAQTPPAAPTPELDPQMAELLNQQLSTYVDQRIREYILQNPEIVVEAIQLYQAKQRDAEREQAKLAIQAQKEALQNDPDSPVAGNPDGDVTVVEFFDYNCPYCRRVTPVLNELKQQDANVRIVFKEFPVLGPASVVAAKAALAAQMQGKYLPFHEAMMEAEGRLEEAQIMDLAAQVGLDLDKLKQDMQSPEIDAMLERNRALADTLRVTGTPSFVVGDEFVGGATDLANLQALVAQERQSAQQ